MNDKAPPKSTAERQRQWRKKRAEQGYEMHTIWLDPDVAQLLNEKISGSDTPQAERTKLINQSVKAYLESLQS
jgi:hypothetical protein